jgi:hypothetical protein
MYRALEPTDVEDPHAVRAFQARCDLRLAKHQRVRIFTVRHLDRDDDAERDVQG